MTERFPGADLALTAERRESVLAATERAVRTADPWAFPVAPRIVRRAIRHQFDLPALSTRVPHRKSFVIAADRLRAVVQNDELGIDPDAVLPRTVILLARPDESELEAMTPDAVRDHFRRLHFHARLDVAMQERVARRELDETAVRDRIERIGHTAFDEIRAVLRHEAFLLPPISALSVYVEFVAVFLELRYFAPDILASYFPSLDDFDRIEAILAFDVDADAVLRMTAGLAADESDVGIPSPSETTKEAPSAFHTVRSERVYQRLLRDAETAAARGNDVRAAILHTRAADSPVPELAQRAAVSAEEDVGRFTGRLRAALDLESSVAEAWRELLAALLKTSAYGFWNPDARLLYDLQKVCLDSERDTYVIDLGAWLRSLGRRSLKRPLPAQREVLMSKHLRVAMSRLPKVQLAGGQREHLAILLRAAAAQAEHRLRDRLRPALERTFPEVGFVPRNLPERVSFRKIVEELLDAVVERGFLAMGDVRDAIARNNLKLDDVANPLELVFGDRLLRADRRLAEVLDGVYQRGPFYLRLLQVISSCAFGTRPGRLFTLYVAIPFGGAYVMLAALDHLIAVFDSAGSAASPPADAVESAGKAVVETAEHASHLTTPTLVIVTGLVVLGLIHHEGFRGLIREGVLAVGRLMRSAFVDLPKWLAEITFINRLLRSPPVVFFRRRLLASVVLTAVFCWAFPSLGSYAQPDWTVSSVVFICLAMLLNSRAGRNIEELAAERAQLMWHRVRVHVFVALFDLVMDSFKRVLEWLERILYEVDEWLRFKSGETGLMLAFKAVLGLFWSAVRFVVRFFVTVLIEPQINPIKHFPVVTVSHKVILPMQPALTVPLVHVFGKVQANMIAGVTVFLLPGVIGFLVWELRGNWRLYAVNRHRRLKPVIVGHHGETLVRLMKLGLHSGTLPRLFSRLRRAARRANPSQRLRDVTTYYARLHHLETDVRRFVEREFLEFLTESKTFRGVRFEIGRTEVGTNSLRIEIRAPQLGADALWVAFEEQSGRTIAAVWRTGWIRNLTNQQRAVVAGLFVGFYRISGVDLVREQIIACLGPKTAPYDVAEAGIVLLPGPGRGAAVVYDPNESPTIVPRNPDGTVNAQHAPVDADSLVFAHTTTEWRDWVAGWTAENSDGTFPELLPAKAHPSSLAPLG